MKRRLGAGWVLLGLILFGSAGLAHSANLAITVEGWEATFTTKELLEHPDTRSITIPDDPLYERDIRYQALPLSRLLDDVPLPPDGEMEMVASDGFASLIPIRLLPGAAGEGAEAWIAVESPGDPWPALENNKGRTGPFYLVWLNPEQSAIRSEQWPYALAMIRLVAPAEERWPQIAVDPGLPADDPRREGQRLFVVQCLACHRLNGAGTATMGPDLNRPVSVTSYFTGQGLRKLIRDPASLRSWPEMRMPGFSQTALSDREVDRIIAYLKHMADR